ncbi:MAG: hypothetical protein PVH76_06295 [Myxococcales bacterium]|jgi:hypothetical protein
MGWLRLSALVGALVAVSWSAGRAAADEGAAALLPFQGAQGAKVRQRVQKALGARGVELVPLQRVNAVVKKTKGYAKQAGALDVDVLVRSRIRRVEERWVAYTEIRNDRGQRVDKLRASSSSLTRLSNRIAAQLVQTKRMPLKSSVSAGAPSEIEPTPPPPTKPRLVVRPFRGAQAPKVRGAAVRGLLAEEVELFPNDRFVAKARSLGSELRSAGGHIAPAKMLGVSGLVEGDVQREDGVWSAYVRLVDGDSSKVVAQHYYEGSSSTALAKRVRARVGPDFRKDIRKLGIAAPTTVAEAPAPTVAEQPAAQVPPEEAPKEVEPPSQAKTKRPAAVDIEVDFRLIHRSFNYRDDIRGELRDYTLDLGPGMGVKFQYFPGAHFTAKVGAQFGIDFEWESLFKFNSTRPDGQTFPTQSQQFLVGARWRYPVKRWEPFLVLDYGVHTFEIGVSGPPVSGEDNTPGVPSVRYQFVRVAGGFRVEIGKKEIFIVGGSIGFRGVFSLGGISSDIWFPEANANGMDAMLMIGFALPKGFEIRLGGDYRRYWFDLNPVPGAARVAGGALDQYWGASAGLAWRW